MAAAGSGPGIAFSPQIELSIRHAEGIGNYKMVPSSGSVAIDSNSGLVVRCRS